MTSRSPTSLPGVDLDSWVLLLYPGRGCILYVLRGIQYGHKVTCHFLMVPTVYMGGFLLHIPVLDHPDAWKGNYLSLG